MNKLWIAFALVSCLVFAACGDQGGGDGAGEDDNGGTPANPMLGTWDLDTASALETLKAELAKEPNPMGEMFINVLEGMTAEMTLSEDGTYEAVMKMNNPMSGEEETTKAKGTWVLEGDQFSITTVEENGVPKETPDVETATYKDGVISIAAKGGAPFSMEFKKRQ